jgi:hypothetical protein
MHFRTNPTEVLFFIFAGLHYYHLGIQLSDHNSVTGRLLSINCSNKEVAASSVSNAGCLMIDKGVVNAAGWG